jgi:hypothetical protein
MGFIRKVAKKVKKGIKKLFSSKIGSFLGSIALGMILGPAVNSVFGGIKGALGFGTKQAVGEAATAMATEGVTAAATEAATGETISKVAGEDLLTSNLAEQAARQETGKAITSESLNKVLETSVTPVEKAANLTSKFAEGTLNGDIPLKVNLNVTDALNDVNNFLETGEMFTPEQTKLIDANLQSQKELASLRSSTEAAFKQVQDQIDFEKSVFDQDIFAEGGYGIDSRSPKFIAQTIKEGPSFMQKLKTGRIGQMAQEGISATGEYLTGSDFLPDIGKGMLGSAISQYMAGEPEQRFGYRGVASQPQQEAAQGAYIQEVGPQFMAATNSTRMPSFQELSQQTLYGNGASQFIGQIYQPLFGV